LIANLGRDPKKHPKPFQPQEFMIQIKKPPVKMNPEEILQHYRLLNAALGGTEKEL